MSDELKVAEMMSRMLNQMVEQLKTQTHELNGQREALAAKGVHMTDDTAALLEEAMESVREKVDANVDEYQDQVGKALEQMRPEEIIEVGEPDQADCVWCGKALEKSDPMSVRAHTMVCEDHPMRQVEADLQRVVRENAGLRAQVNALGHQINTADARSDQCAVVLGRARVLLRDIQLLLEESLR